MGLHFPPEDIPFKFLGEDWLLKLRAHRTLRELWEQCLDYNPDISDVVGLTVADWHEIYVDAQQTPGEILNTTMHELFHVACSPQFDEKHEELKALCIGDVAEQLLWSLGLADIEKDPRECRDRSPAA